jgi:hypothetical protein
MSGVRVETVSIPLPNISVQRPSRVGSELWRVTLSRFMFGRGKTLKAAKAELAQQIALATETVNIEPAFARDDDGTVIVALDRPWGFEWYRVTDTHAQRISTGDRHPEGPAADLARVDHYKVLPAYTSNRAAGESRPRLFTMGQIEQVLDIAHSRAHDHVDNAAALAIFRMAVTALLVNPDSKYPNGKANT